MPARKKKTADGGASGVVPAPSVAGKHFKVTKKRGPAASKKGSKDGEEVKPKKTPNRFNGMSEEEVAKRGLPDHLKEGLDVVFIGINPSLAAAYTGRYYDGPGNHFWQALFLSGFLPRPMGPQDDTLMMDLGIGFTNVVARTTRGIADLSRKEIADGAVILREKMSRYRPKVAVFNGKAIYQVYSGQKKFMFGKQPDPMEDTEGKTNIWVMPSSSARCAQLPRAVDKVPFFSALKRYLDFLKGLTDEPHEEEIVFANVVLKNQPRKVKTEVKEEVTTEEMEEAEDQAATAMEVVPAPEPVPVPVPAPAPKQMEPKQKKQAAKKRGRGGGLVSREQWLLNTEASKKDGPAVESSSSQENEGGPVFGFMVKQEPGTGL